ncbi:MAG: ABC transporter permease [Deltaproteobacteria bacterium]|nr:ABC transporter permease [Deltaproteobacteria bacterium]MBW2020108.1 ABC transporter permease [Deltaproteobacteria bacterium]MBW2074745.1 ABC transporter permease [Deltaproteobacteria bacterium]RLB82129.1 MAG: ABC transporter [Deltaproteobacteria bacterium]
MIRGWFAIYYRELLILKRKFFRQAASMSVAPLLYFIAFGFGMGRNVTIGGHSYLEFLVPGLVAMSSMTQAFAIGVEINVARFYWHIFDEFQSAPIHNLAYVMGEVLAGITRAVLSSAIILIIGGMSGIILSYNILFWLGVIFNAFVFSSAAVCSAMLVKSHGDQALLTNFIITPMAFLGGTFFPVEHLPFWAQKLLNLLPLTHASHAIRDASYGKIPGAFSYVLLPGLGIIFFIAAIYCVRKAKN